MIDKIKKRIIDFLQTTPVFREWLDKQERQQNVDLTSINPFEVSGFSFVIITDGRNRVILEKCIDSILKECKSRVEFEIIIVGPIQKISWAEQESVTILNYIDGNVLPGWITLKKNIGVYKSRFDTVIVLHDYIEFVTGWFNGFKDFNALFPDWDVLLNRVEFLDGRRTRDWIIGWDDKEYGPALVPYEVQSPKYQYINGTYFIVKRRFYIENPLDDRLRWAEGEDVEWSRRIRDSSRILFNSKSTVRFLKPKPKSEPPYDQLWLSNTARYYSFLGLKYIPEKVKP